jgi:hypothetical protein
LLPLLLLAPEAQEEEDDDPLQQWQRNRVLELDTNHPCNGSSSPASQKEVMGRSYI